MPNGKHQPEQMEFVSQVSLSSSWHARPYPRGTFYSRPLDLGLWLYGLGFDMCIHGCLGEAYEHEGSDISRSSRPHLHFANQHGSLARVYVGEVRLHSEALSCITSVVAA